MLRPRHKVARTIRAPVMLRPCCSGCGGDNRNARALRAGAWISASSGRYARYCRGRSRRRFGCAQNGQSGECSARCRNRLLRAPLRAGNPHPRPRTRTGPSPRARHFLRHQRPRPLLTCGEIRIVLAVRKRIQSLFHRNLEGRQLGTFLFCRHFRNVPNCHLVIQERPQ